MFWINSKGVSFRRIELCIRGSCLAENTLLWEEGLLDLDNSSYGNLEVNLKRKDFHVFEDKFSPS
jgi:hypothetical protein